MNTVTAVLAPLASIGAGCFFLYAGWKSYFSTRNMSNWMITQGVITRSNVKQAGTAFLPDVEYQYSMLGVEYKGRSVTIPPNLMYDIEVAREFLEEYPVGKSVDVFYNPENHQIAVLEKEAVIGTWLILVMANAIGLTFFILGFAYLLPLFK